LLGLTDARVKSTEDKMTQRKATAATREAVSDTSISPASLAEHGDLAPDELRRRIAETAYYLAAARDFAAGDCVQDWIEAEIMVHAAIAEDREA
jgi:Protein of unknown function (DUF2934)